MMALMQRSLARSVGALAVRHSPTQFVGLRTSVVARAEPAASAPADDKPVSKTELISMIAEETGHPQKITGEIINKFIEVVQEEVAAGGKITLTGFGSFEKRHRKARVGNNPQKPGMKIDIPATDVPAFSAGTEFKRIVKGEPPKPKAPKAPKAAKKTA